MSNELQQKRIHPIAGYQAHGTIIRTYFDTVANQWFFEHIVNRQLVDRRGFGEAKTPQSLFDTAVRKIADRLSVRRKTPISALDAPFPIKGVMTYDPARRRRRITSKIDS